MVSFGGVWRVQGVFGKCGKYWWSMGSVEGLGSVGSIG